MTYNTLFLSLAFIITAFPLKAKVNTFMLRQLKTEYMSCPIGLDTTSPRFSWQMSAVSRQRGLKQKAFCIQVFNEQDKEIWNTGKCISPESLNIIYKGATLQPMTRYKWKVKVWDEKGISVTDSSYFETGLMSSIPYQNWSNARWIGGGKEDLPLYANYLPVFKLNFKLNEKTHSTQAGFVYGANDPRLMDANKNIYNLTNVKDKSYK